MNSRGVNSRWAISAEGQGKARGMGKGKCREDGLIVERKRAGDGSVAGRIAEGGRGISKMGRAGEEVEFDREDALEKEEARTGVGGEEEGCGWSIVGDSRRG